jgi:hypothetical protein
MKSILLSIAVLTVIFIVFQSFTSMSTRKTREQKYTVVFSGKNFEIRFYPSATLATVRSGAKTYRELANPGFRTLAGYIFGGNESNTSIAMTAPVHMDVNDSVSSMSFVMPEGFDETNLPAPNDSRVIIEKIRDEYVAALRFGGFASDRDLEFYSKKLQEMLQEKGIIATGHYRYLGYNPPFQLFGRRNEIIVEVEWPAPGKR